MAKLACYPLIALALCSFTETSFAIMLEVEASQTVDIEPCNGTVVITSDHEVSLEGVESYQHGFGYFLDAKIKNCGWIPLTWASSYIEGVIGQQNTLTKTLQTVRLCGSELSVLSKTTGGYSGEYGWSTPDETDSTPCDVITCSPPHENLEFEPTLEEFE